MNPLFWVAAGAAGGAYALTKARRVAEAATPEGLEDRLAGLSVGLRLFSQEVRAGMAEKENELRERLALVPPGSRARSGLDSSRGSGHRKLDHAKAGLDQPKDTGERRSG